MLAHKVSVSDFIYDHKGIIDIQVNTNKQVLETNSHLCEIRNQIKSILSPYRDLSQVNSDTDINCTYVAPIILHTSSCHSLIEQVDISIINKHIFETNGSSVINKFIYMLYYYWVYDNIEQLHIKRRLTNNCITHLDHVYTHDWTQVCRQSEPFWIYNSNINNGHYDRRMVEFTLNAVIRQQRDIDVNHYPLVSCLMVTQYRLAYVKRAIKNWKQQTYPNRELVIVCYNDQETRDYVMSLTDENIRLHYVSTKIPTALGLMRHASVQQARGSILATWDDDDWNHPTRLELQISILRQYKVDIVCLARISVVWPTEKAYCCSDISKHGWENTAVWEKCKYMPYRALNRFEDTQMFNDMKHNGARTYVMDIECGECLYVYLIHGHNTWNNAHYKRIFRSGTSLHHMEFYDTSRMEIQAETMTRVTDTEYIGIEDYSSNTYWDWIRIVLVIILIICVIVGIWFGSKLLFKL